MDAGSLNRKLADAEFNRSLSRKYVKRSTKTRVRLYRKLSRCLRNNMDLTSALNLLHQHESEDGKNPAKPSAICVEEWREYPMKGLKLGDAMNGWVPDRELIVIAAGEESGKLAGALDDAEHISTSVQTMKRTVVGGMLYPVALFAIAIGFVVMFGVEIVPQFADTLPTSRWRGSAATLADISFTVQNYGLYILGAILLVAGAIAFSMPRLTGKIRVKLDSIPPWSFYRMYNGSAFMVSMSAMMNAGISESDILAHFRKGANPWLRERVGQAKAYVDKTGLNLGEALHRSGHGFPDKETVRDLRAYAELEGLDVVLSSMGREWMEESLRTVKMQVRAVGSVSLLMMGGVIGFLISSVFSLAMQVGQAAQSGGM